MIDETRAERWARRALSVLLHLYPWSFRRDLGEDLVETAFHRHREAIRRHGSVGVLAFWLTEGVRFALDGLVERVMALSAVRDDVRQAWRQLRRAPAHHALAIATLALGVGATASILTVADAVVFRPLPYPDAHALYLIHSRLNSQFEISGTSLLNLRDLQASVRSMSWLAGARDRSPTLIDESGPPERVAVLDVTAEYLRRLGARVAAGRPFVEADHVAGAERVALISDALWRRRWGGNPAAIGVAIQLNDVSYTVVGVVAGGFRDPEPIESGTLTSVWTAVREGDSPHRGDYSFRVLGRLAPGSSHAVAARELTDAGRRLAEVYPAENRSEGADLDFVLHRLHEMTVSDARDRLLLLLGAVVLLLALACANVANLFLVRGVTRVSELAVRSALGATRARLALQLFIESLVTAAVSGVVGALLGAAGVRAFVAASPAGIPRLHEVSLDARALLLVLGLTVLTAVVFGTVPAVRNARVAEASGPGLRATAPRRTRRLQTTTVAIEVALALVLVTGSALLLNSFRHLLLVPPGFDPRDVTVVELRPPFTAKTAQAELAFHATLLERARAMPGVMNAALSYSVPGGIGGAWARVTVDRQLPAGRRSQRTKAPAYGTGPFGDEYFRFNPVLGDFFETLDIPLRAGRTFGGDPGPADPLVVILNESAARQFFPDEDQPIGRRLALGTPDSDAPLREVVGIIADVHERGPAFPPDPQIYLPYGQRDFERMQLLIERRPGATITAAMVRKLVTDVAPEVPVDRVEALADRYASTADQTRFLALLLTVFAGIGLVLAAVGTYATVSHLLSSRNREMAIRMALGARPRTVLGLGLRGALGITGIGIAAGIALTLAFSRFIEAHVHGVGARDPVTVTAAVAVIAACVLVASLRPALRAARVNANDVLRVE